MNLTELFRNPKIALVEGGNLEIDNPNFDPTQPESPTNTRVIQAQEIQLAPTKISDEVQDRTHMVGVLKNLFMDINKTFTVIYKTPLFDPAILDKEIKEFMAGSSQHFFDLLRPNPNFNPKQPESENNPKMIGLSDEEFKKYKPTVGDIDIQCNQDLKEKLFEFLNNHINVPIGNETLLGAPSAGNEQYNTLWQLADPPIKVQIDFEYGKYSPITQKPDEWTKFSHSSSWEDIQQNIKGVFHKYIYRALAKAAPEAKYIARLSGLGKKRAMALFGGSDAKEQFADVNNPPQPFIDANFSFSVASKGGGGLRAKYKPVDPGLGIPTEINGIPVMQELKSTDSEYEQDLNKQFVLFFGKAPQGNDRKLQDSFVGTLELMNKYLDDNGKRNAASDFFDIVFEPGSQMLTKGDPKRDYATKFAAIDKMLAVLGLEDMKQTAETMAQEYEQDYNDVEVFRQANPNEKQPRAAMKRQRAELKEEAQVKAQFRKGMPHLHDLKPADLLDLLDEIHDGNGSFKLQNIPLNVKVDGFGGRFGKNSEGKPFMGTSRTEPRYAPGFVDYHQKKGTTDPEILGRAQLFDDLFEEMMNAIKLVDSKLGPGFLVNKQVTCEVLYLPFATETPEGKLKFVGIHYDKLPAGVKLALVPFRITDATTGDDLPNSTKIVKELTSAGKLGSVMFIDNSLTQNEALDVTALVPPVENIEQLKAMLASNKLEARRQVKAALEPVAVALEKAIINDPNIIGKELLGQDYEGIVINSRLGPIKVTSQEQRDVITAKNAAKVNARTERPRGEAKTAVVAVGSFAGHIGHQELFKLTIDKATSLGGDPYLFMGSRVGKDDPIPINDKLKTWKMLYPQYANNISAMTQPGGSLIQKMKHELINPLEGKPPRYDNVIIMTGKEDDPEENAEKGKWPSVLMKAVNKFQGYEHVKSSIEFTDRGTGISFTQLRNDLKTKTPEQAFAAWSNAFNAGKSGAQPLPPDWIKHLMDVSRTGMKIQEPQQPAQQQQPVPKPEQEPVAEQRLFNSLIRPINEGTSIESTMRAIINDIGEPITSVYDTMKFQAKKYMENHGELGRGFRMVAAGVGGRWVQNMYTGRLHNELHDLCKYNTRRTGELRDFLRGVEADGELEMKRSFGNLASNLPPILAKLGQHLNAPQLTRNAQRWMQNKAEYERYLMDLEADSDEQDDTPISKPPKSNIVGQQNAQVDQVINDILSKVPKNIAGDIRNAIARAPNKLAALKQELDRHHVKMAEDAMAHMAKDLTGHGSPIAKAAAQRDKKREQYGSQNYGRPEGPKWNVAEAGMPGGLSQQGVEEGWDDIKKFSKKAAVAGAIGLGIGAANASGWSPSDVPAGGHNQLPDIVAHVKFKVGDKEVSKEINLGSHYRSPGEAGEELKNFLQSKGIKFYQYRLERVKPTDGDKIDSSPATSDMKGSMDTSEPSATGPSKNDYMAKDNDPEHGPSMGGKFVKEGPQDDPEDYRAHLIKTLPQMMNFLAKSVKGWSPSEEQYLAAIETGYEVMKHTGDVQQAGRAISDELNTLHRMSQGQQGVSEGEQEYGSAWDEKVNRLGQMAKEGPRKTVWDPVKRVYKTVPVNTPKKEEPKQIPVSENVQDIMDNLINKIIVNEAISNNRK